MVGRGAGSGTENLWDGGVTDLRFFLRVLELGALFLALSLVSGLIL